MAYINLDEDKCEEAVIGGAFLGGGGGGSREEGLNSAKLSIRTGDPKILDINDLNNGKIVTVSAVGAPAADNKYLKPSHYVKAIELMRDKYDIKISGMISSESGALATVNGWFQSSILGIPVIDAPCDGRAHPTGKMGSINVDQLEDYESFQTAVGGNSADDRYIEAAYQGKVTRVSKLVRQVSIQAGGLVSVVRNPVSVEYVKNNAAIGSIKQAISIGESILDKKVEGVKEILNSLDGKIKGEGRVLNKNIVTKDGFDVGTIELPDNKELTFWNEFMTLEQNGKRIATFPDLIFAVRSKDGIPITTAEIKEGESIIIGFIPKENISLGSGVKNHKNLKKIENVLNKKILKFNKDF